MQAMKRYHRMIAASEQHGRRVARRYRSAERGMTLIEIMVVITILGLIAAAVGVAVIPQLDNAKVDTSRNTISSIETALKLYYTRHGKYPDTGSGLGVLVQEKFLDKAPKDGFGNDFVYLNEGGKYTIMSYGKDQSPGGEGADADVSNQDTAKK